MICFVSAFLFEARPLIRHFGLKQTSDRPYLIYQKEDIVCMITGSGKISMAAGIGYLAGRFCDPTFINVGCAGHKDLPLGSAFLIDQIEDKTKKQNYYPSLFFPWKKESKKAITVEHIEKNYPENGLYEQEGSAFFHVAMQYTFLEHIQLIKVVSDNLSFPVEKLTKNKIEKIMQEALPLAEKLITTFRNV